MIKIGEKALEVLKGMSVINEGVILRPDYLYTKFELSTDDAKAKGVEGIVVNYDLPTDEIAIEEPVGIGNITEFLTILKTFNADKLTMAPKGTTIVMKDQRKNVTFYTTTPDALPEKNTAGDELYKSGKTILNFVLDEAEIEKVTRDLSILNVDKLSLKSEDGGIKIVAENEVTANTTEVDVEQKFVITSDGDFEFPNSKIFDVIMHGIYNIEVKACDYNGKTINICKFISKTYPGLSYTAF